VTAPNVVLITVDSLRADMLGFMGSERGLTPNWDALAGESLVFRRAYSTGPVTPHAMPGILTSTYPFDFQGPVRMDPPRVLLSEAFQRAGFVTAAFNSNGFMSEFHGYNRGWDAFEDFTPPDELSQHVGPRSDSSVSNAAKWLLRETTLRLAPEWFFRMAYMNYRRAVPTKVRANLLNATFEDFLPITQQAKRPIFAWLHYMDVHNPYEPAELRGERLPLAYEDISFVVYGNLLARTQYTHIRRLKKTGRQWLTRALELYEGEIAYFDSQLGQLVSFLKQQGIYDDTIICVTADHGDEFYEHEGGTHTPKLYDELLHVPLTIKGANNDLTFRLIDQAVTTLDVAPTLCGMIGVRPDPAFKGRDLLSQNDPRPVFHETLSAKGAKSGFLIFDLSRLEQCQVGCTWNDWRYVVDHGLRTEKLFDLTRDPGEQQNLAASNPARTSEFRELVTDFEKTNPPFALAGR
jgi:arylsulfatase A-like enzyme